MRIGQNAQTRRMIRGLVGPGAIRCLQWMVARRSWAGTQALGRRMGSVGFRLDRRHRVHAEANVRLAFGEEIPQRRVHEIVCGCLQHLTMLFLETLRMTSMTPDELAQVARIEGGEHLRGALEAGRGAVFFSGHLGNWEVGGVRLIYEGFPVIPLSRAATNPRLARAISAVRARLDFPVIPVEEGARGILRALKQNQLVAIMPDRFARGGGVTVPFFGQLTHVWHTPALMAQRAGCPILPVHILRQPDGSFVVEVDPPVEMVATGDRDFDVWATTARTMALFEAKVRRHPEQFTWPYELWRPAVTPPPPYPLERLTEAGVLLA